MNNRKDFDKWYKEKFKDNPTNSGIYVLMYNAWLAGIAFQITVAEAEKNAVTNRVLYRKTDTIHTVHNDS